MDHFDAKDAKERSLKEGQGATGSTTKDIPVKPENKLLDDNVPEADSPAGQALAKQLQQIAGGQPVLQNVAVNAANAAANTAGNGAGGNNPSKFQQCIAEGDLEFVSKFFVKILCFFDFRISNSFRS